ncbi:MAG TPA: GNAT family protein [Bacillales bacterium]|nr:GNAT family protein [Bacillales bacterium]
MTVAQRHLKIKMKDGISLLIKGKKVELRPVSLEDFKKTYDWRNDEETAMLSAGSYLFQYSHVPKEKIEEEYDKDIKKLDKRERGEFSIYTLEEEPNYIGSIGYRQLDIVSRRCTIGIGIGEKGYWNQGYGSDSVQTLVRYLFQTMNLNRIQLDTWSGNERAIRSYEKCGFVIEGRLRKNAFVDGKYHDTIIMGLLKEEFQS